MQPVRIRQEPLWLPAGLLAVLATLSLALSAYGDGPKLQWRRAATPSRPSSHFTTHTANSSTVLKTASRTNHHVRRMGYDGRANNGRDNYATHADYTPTGQASVHSIVVYDNYDPYSNQYAQSGTRDELQRRMEEPFGADLEPLPAEDQLDDSGFDMPVEMPEESPSNDDLDQFDTLPPTVQPRNREPSPAMEKRRDPFDEPSRSRNSSRDRDVEEIDSPRERPSARRDRSSSQSSEKAKATQACAEGLAALKANRLHMVDIHIGVPGSEGEDYPYACSIDDGSVFAPRCWEQVTYMWKASALCHKPLYFENVQLERYGHSWGPHIQPLVSGAHFFTRLPVLPYCMGIKAPNECEYALGHYRPGSCAPYLIYPIPFTWKAALMEAGAWTGAALAIP